MSGPMKPYSTMPAHPRFPHHTSRHRGVSLVELLIALAITAMLLTATMVAMDVSFKAYADASEQASTHAATRMITQRVLTMVRTSTLHGPLTAQASRTRQLQDPEDPTRQYSVTLPAATIAGNIITSPYMELITQDNQHVALMYVTYSKPSLVEGQPTQSLQELWLVTNPDGAVLQGQPLIGNVTAASFTCLRRKNGAGLYVLERGSMDLTVQPDPDATLALESGHTPPIRVIASTMPRRVE